VSRPSSARRLGNLRALVDEFDGRDIGCAGVAVFLGCSLSAARNYISELLDAGILNVHPAKQGPGCADRIVYRLAADPAAVQRFRATLGDPDGAAVQCQRPCRDPLVAALFGAPAAQCGA
jgi:hypothetical protein